MSEEREGKSVKLKKVFIDGSAGTTGLRIRERLAGRGDLECIVLADSIRKDPAARRAALNAADVAFLCLPDAAAVEAAAMVENPGTVVIDTSTAHRCADGWAYGFPELAGQRARLAHAKRIANPGCHASGFVALVAPLVAQGLLSPDARLSAFSLTGYSGGGKKMIADYAAQGSLFNVPCSSFNVPCSADGAHLETMNHEPGTMNHEPGTMNHEPGTMNLFAAGRQYALGQAHKHLPEMVRYCGLSRAPVFSPVVVPHLSGMEVTVPLFADEVKGGLEAVRACYRDSYGDGTGLVSYAEALDDGGFVSSAKLSGRDGMLVSAYGNGERMILVALFDNLGKGASGAAIQNMNIALGVDERCGLVP